MITYPLIKKGAPGACWKHDTGHFANAQRLGL